MPSDPLEGLEDWARQAERRARRSYRLAAVSALPRRVLRQRRWIAGLVVAALVAGAWFSRGWWSDVVTRLRPDAAAGPHGNASATPPSGPFDISPVSGFAQGEAGFVMPEPGPLDGWATQDVVSSLATVRSALIAGYLDRMAVVGHDPAGIRSLVAVNTRDYLQRRYADPTEGGFGVLISPKVRLTDDQPRVQGSATVRTTTDEYGRAVLEIVTNFVVVYAFDVPDRGPGTRIAGDHTEVTWQVTASSGLADNDRGLWIRQSRSYSHNVDCSEARKGLLAPATPYDGWPGNGTETERPNAAYDPAHTLNVEDDCR